MNEAYIVAPLRSAVGKGYKGSLVTKRPDDLCADLIKGVLGAAGEFDHAKIEDVIVGCAMPESEQGMNIGRFAALLAGLPDSVPGVTVNRFCSSGIQTIAMAATQVMAGDAQCLLAGGTESMTLVPMMGHKPVGSRTVMDQNPEFYLNMGLTAENVADEYKVSREEQDTFALKSHQKAVAAIEKGLFREEILPVQVERRRFSEGVEVKVEERTFDRDEIPRPDTNIESLGKLRAVFRLGGSVTAGNSSPISDGAAMCLVCSEAFLKAHNLTPVAKFLSFAVAGVPPRIMGIGPVAAIPRALQKAGKKMEDVERIELNEAFAAQSLAVIKTLDLNPEIVNPTGGAIALGHPLGATGAKLAATLIHGLKRDKQKLGLVTMCIGTGMGAAALIEGMY